MEAPSLTIERARALRRSLTLPEGLLWSALRGRRLGGLRFRRQHPIGPYILDFFCSDLALAVEVDGWRHDDPDQIRHDRRRDAWLSQKGVHLLRIPARDVLADRGEVLDRIRRVAAACPLHRPSDGPPPPQGEEWGERLATGGAPP
ncbi:MAG: endonuclease domain-containing protein [Brevundimonas sp.]|jgi:very-short-patch-repair endonuclease|uniref:endonuclease domain-containing protein n=1 Tax=Brevundimonas sp. TaxID=1871086 RepID=UPI003919C1F8